MFFVILFILTLVVQAQTPFPGLPIAIGGAFTQNGSAFGFATSTNSATSVTSAATGGLVNTATIVNAPSSTHTPTIPTLNRYVPDYRNTATTPTKTTANTATKRKVKVQKHHKPQHQPQRHPNVCWKIFKRCCYEPFQKGYKCKDYYVYKYTRCHPIVEYRQICGEIKEEPEQHPKPHDKVLYGESVIKNYDSRYGPHVPGYPDGESDFYDTPDIPQRPHGVNAEPFDPASQYHNGNTGPQTNSGTGSHGGGYPTAPPGRGYTAQPRTSAGYTSQQNTSHATGPTKQGPPHGQQPVAAVDNPGQAGGTYRFMEPL